MEPTRSRRCASRPATVSTSEAEQVKGSASPQGGSPDAADSPDVPGAVKRSAVQEAWKQYQDLTARAKRQEEPPVHEDVESKQRQPISFSIVGRHPLGAEDAPLEKRARLSPGARVSTTHQLAEDREGVRSRSRSRGSEQYGLRHSQTVECLSGRCRSPSLDGAFQSCHDDASLPRPSPEQSSVDGGGGAGDVEVGHDEACDAHFGVNVGDIDFQGGIANEGSVDGVSDEVDVDMRDSTDDAVAAVLFSAEPGVDCACVRESAPQEAAKPASVSPAEGQSHNDAEHAIHTWLQHLDNGRGSMLRYYEIMKREFECDFAQIAAAKLTEAITPGSVGRIDPSFFEVLGVKSAGHKLLLAKGILELPD